MRKMTLAGTAFALFATLAFAAQEQRFTDKSNNTLGMIDSGGNAVFIASVTASAFWGDGSNLSGTVGMTGATGATGTTGPTGTTGEAGATGAGVNGATGATGVEGATGPGVGATGATGAQPLLKAGETTNYLCSSSQASDYCTFLGTPQYYWTSGGAFEEDEIKGLVTVAGEAKNMNTYTSASNVGYTTFTFRVNGADTTLQTFYDPYSSGWQSDNTHIVSLAAGDFVSIGVASDQSVSGAGAIKVSLSMPAIGAEGAMGATGVEGATGATGIEGATGATGIDGVTGATGAAGIDGVTGATGPQGLSTAGEVTFYSCTIGAGNCIFGASPSYFWTEFLGVSTFEDHAQSKVTVAGEAKKLNTFLSSAELGYTTFTFRLNGADTTLTTHYDPGETGWKADNTNIVTLAVDDLVNIAVVSDAPPSGSTSVKISLSMPAVGSAGATGPTGPSGGPTGATGATGTIGGTGVTGATGIVGATGPTGSIGSTGSMGPDGISGATGIAGATGATGVEGATGSTGIEGATGATGIEGATGVTGSVAYSGSATINKLVKIANGTIPTLIDSVVYESGGNVGIGTTNPGHTLTLASINSSALFNTTGASGTLSTDAITYAGSYPPPLATVSSDYDALGPVFISNRATSSGVYMSVIKTRTSRPNTDADTVVASGDNILTLKGGGADGTLFKDAASITMDVDATPGTSDMPGRITFNTTPDGSATLAERMRITNGGNVGIGTTNPVTALDVAGTIQQTGAVSCSLGVVTDASGGFTSCASSDKSLKTSVTTLSNRGVVDALRPVLYKWTAASKKDKRLHAGFIAQEVEKIFPEAVSSTGKNLKGVDANAIVAALVAEVQALRKRVAALEAKK